MPDSRRGGGQYGAYGQQYNAYQSQHQHGQEHDRRPSFDYGDDSNIGRVDQPQQQTYQAYGHNQTSAASPPVGTQGYGGQYAAAPPPIQTNSYNPANYAVQGQPTPIISSPRIAMPAGNYAAAHPAYNPAAYSSTSPQSQQGNFYQPYQSPPLNSYNYNQTPPLPPKPPELVQQSSSPYPSAPADRRGAVSTASNANAYAPYGAPTTSTSYAGYTPPAPPPPPSHNYSTAPYQPYSPPLPQSQPAPPPPEHRRLPSIPQDDGSAQHFTANSQRSNTGWAPRLPGASLASASQDSPQPLAHRTSSTTSTQSRPLPPPPGSANDLDHFATNGDDARSQQDAIFAEIEAQVMGRPPTISRRPVPARGTGSQSTTNGRTPSTTSNSLGINADTPQSHNHLSAASDSYAEYNGDSDAEAAAGLQAMQIAEQHDVGRPNRHQSVNSFGTTSTAAAPAQTHGTREAVDDDSDGVYVPMDISMGFDPGFGYGPGIGSPPFSPPIDHTSTTTPGGTIDALSFPDGNYEWANTNDELLSPRMTARVDTGGIGGLVEPTARRMSFDDGDEATLVDLADQRSSTSASPTKFDSGYLHRTGSGRPLPPTPENGALLTPQRHQSHQDRFDPDSYEARMAAAAAADVRKTNSLSGAGHQSTLSVPERSVTDAEQRRRHGHRSSYYDLQAKADAAFPGPGEIDLPSIPAGRRRKFSPAKLSSKEYAECKEPWAISGILSWIKSMTEGEHDLKEQPIIDALIGLFTHKVPTMNIADAEVLSANLVAQMIHEAALVRDEEWVKFSPLKMSGVIYQLTGTGCYSSRVHTTTMQGRCYARHCMRTLRKIDLQAQQLAPERKAEDWQQFYNFSSEDIKGFDPKAVQLQYNLHEVITSEDKFMDSLDILLVLYRDGLVKGDKQIIALTGKPAKFVDEVFGKVPALKEVNEDYLLSRLKYRQQEQGPWITGFSDIFREWIRRARVAYIEYASGLPNAISQIRQQIERNVLFKQFLAQVQQHPRTLKLGWDTFIKAPITRLQRYSLLLETINKAMKVDSQEKQNLIVAIKEIRAVTLECDAKVAEMTRRTDMLELTSKLKLRPGMDRVQLNLAHLGRQIIHRGDLTRRGNSNINWVETHAILFDHYLVLAKTTRTKDSHSAVNTEYYDVSKLPIPMDLLVLESADDGTVMKHSVKGIVPLGTTAVSKPAGPGTPDLRLTRTATGSQPTEIPPNNRTNSTPNPSQTSTYGQTDVADTSNLFYPFRVQHLGRSDSYVLYASTPQIRSEWAAKITFAKKQHAASLFAQNAEPFKLHVLADTAFAYSYTDFIGVLPVHIPGTPLDRALRDIDREHGAPEAKPTPVCRSPVNCATAFTPPSSTRSMLAVGTDFGVFITDQENPRGWYKAINATHVTQIAVLEDFSVLLIIADKALIAFHLDAVCPPQGGPPSNANDQKRTPQKLSGSRDVGFFSVGRMKDRMLVFYKKRDGISSTFKVLEPVYHKSSTASSSSSSWGRSRFGLKKGTTEFFRDFDDFYIASDTYAINLFSSSFGIATQKGIEVLTLDKKVPMSIPELRAPEVQSIAVRIKDQRPLGMFRLTDSEFLLVFEEVAIYVDKHGDISRTVIMEFVGKARQAALYNGTYLVLVDVSGSFVEVRNATDGRLRQVVPGKDVKMLDDGMAAGATTSGMGLQAGLSRGTIKISMMHPEIDHGCVVLEMLVNEGIKEA